TREDSGRIKATVRGSIAQDDAAGAIYYKPVHNPSVYAGETIERMLALRGVDVKGKVKIGAAPKTGLVPVTVQQSKPLAEVISTLNKYSNNFIAEQILKTLAAELRGAPGTWD